MKQGAAKHALKERKHDLNETPPEAVRTLLRVENLPVRIWEPCAGRGAISRILADAGHEIYATDLNAHAGADPYVHTGIDFLMETRRPEGCDTIVTNPPFKLADQFIRRGLALECRVIVLLRLMAIEGGNRSDINDFHLRRVWAGRERLPMMHRDGWEGKKIDKGGMPFGWFVYEPEAHSSGTPIQLQRMSWRD